MEEKHNRRVRRRKWYLMRGWLYWIERGAGLVMDCCLMLAVVGAGFLFAMALTDRPLESSFLWLWAGLMLVFGGGLLPGRGLGYRLALVGGSCGSCPGIGPFRNFLS